METNRQKNNIVKEKEKRIFICEVAIIIGIILVLLAVNLIGTVKVSVEKERISNKTFADLNKEGIEIGTVLGTTTSNYIKEKFDKADVQFFNTNEDIYEAVGSGVINAGTAYGNTIKKVIAEYENMSYINTPIYTSKNSFAMPKTENGKKLCDEFNKFFNEIKQNGTYDYLDEKWSSLDEKKYKLENYNLTGENGTLRVVTGGLWVPKTFIFNNVITGLFIDVVNAFCEKYGYIPKYEVASYAAELAGITSGKYDMMADIAEETEERKKTVYLTIPVYYEENYFIIHDKDQNAITVAKKDVFFSNLKEGFKKNFIVDNRWKMFANGLLVTILLAIFSAIFGTILGSIICFFRMNNNSFLNAFARLYIKIIQGTPIVVLLMVLNYLVFNNTGLSAFVVSIIGFSIDFAAYVSEIFRAGIEAVPSGQLKAAYALGFSKMQSFFKVVLPQALIHIIPVYSGQFISMVKLTSVAGYISVQDLTKISDYVRSLTYEAFFPLISTAIIYFLLSALFVLALRYIEKKIDPRFRKRTIRGIKI